MTAVAFAIIRHNGQVMSAHKSQAEAEAKRDRINPDFVIAERSFAPQQQVWVMVSTWRTRAFVVAAEGRRVVVHAKLKSGKVAVRTFAPEQIAEWN